MTNVIYGNDLLLFYKDSATEAVEQLIAAATSHKIGVKMETRDTSSKDSGSWEEVIAGNLSWDASVDALYTMDKTKGYDKLFEIMVNRRPITLYSGIAATGVHDDTKTFYSGTAYITGIDINAGNKDNVSYSVTFKGTGAITASLK